VIRACWPTAISVSGAEACLRALRESKTAILLYQRTPRIQHYVFVRRDGAAYQLENQEDTGSVSETDMTAYMKKEPMVWTI
jgi:hypothetical protein